MTSNHAHQDNASADHGGTVYIDPDDVVKVYDSLFRSTVVVLRDGKTYGGILTHWRKVERLIEQHATNLRRM